MDCIWLKALLDGPFPFTNLTTNFLFIISPWISEGKKYYNSKDMEMLYFRRVKASMINQMVKAH